jgi:hypothetical protein
MQTFNKVGEFIGTITNQFLGKSAQKKTPFVGLEIECDGMVAYWNGYLTPKTFENTMAALCEVNPDWDGDLKAINDGDAFVDFQCKFTNEQEGKYYKVQWLHGVNGGPARHQVMASSEVDDTLGSLVEDAKRLAAQKRAEAVASGGQVSRPERVEAAPASKTKDDLPF